MSNLQGKVAVITGGGSGIGLATAQRFVQEGAYVYITGRRQSELDKAVVLIGSNVTAVQGDVTSLPDLDRLYATIQAEKGQLDIVVANSGIVEPKSTFEANETHFDKTFNINAKGVFYTVQKALPLMGKGGAIIVVSSIVSSKGFPGYATYSATKAAVRSFVRTWTMELKERGIRVNTVSPGPVDTPMIDSQAESKEGADQVRAFFATQVPLGRMGQAQEIAAAALFLASDESSYIAGIDLPVDGGMAQV
ncbi:glucose 1-dehydrogenase [Janthinobacterium sp.]|uniref:SDR family NAD(P)-dependent oxidoreductase n=1 Tax=Janthinobacterium sp. TaxID=1871054 RepID=UPI002624E856|nr:glucose 1-dehydrogenase [Janthinobacterium sp.]